MYTSCQAREPGGTAINRTSQRTRRDLTRDEIVDVAEAIMHDEGERAVNMRRVADACGVTAMAIYHHVGSKEDLLTLVVDRVVGDAISAFPLVVDWRASMVAFTRAFRAGLLQNPGAAAVFLRRPIISDNLALATEQLFAILEQGGITGSAAAEAVDAIVLLMIGSIANDLTRPAGIRRELVERTTSTTTPRLDERIEDYAARDPEQRFVAALGWLLEGMAPAEASA